MKIDDFSGGLNIRTTPNKLLTNEAQVFNNVDNVSGALQPVKGNTDLNTSINEWFTWYYAKNEWFSKTGETSFVEYKDLLYYTILSNKPKFYDGTGEKPIGIEKPVTAPVIASQIGTPFEDSGDFQSGEIEYIRVSYLIWQQRLTYDYGTVTVESPENTINLGKNLASGLVVTVYRKLGTKWYEVGTLGVAVDLIDDVVDISANTELDITPDLRDYNYVYTYYDSTTGIESQPSDISNTFKEIYYSEYPTYSMTLSNITAGTVGDKIRVYRLGDSITSYTLVKEIDISSTSTIDNYTSDSIVNNYQLDTYTYTTPPSGLKYIIEAYAMLFGAVDDKLYFSEIALPWAWPVTNFIEFDDTITGIGAVPNGILVFTEFKTFIVTGTSPDTFSRYLLDSSQGCESHYSIQYVDNTLIWLSKDGLCVSNGGKVQVITSEKLGKLSLTNVKNSAVLDRVYYLVHSTGILVYDFRYNNIIRNITSIVDTIGSFKDALYNSTNGALYSMLTGDNLEYTWKSPIITGGSFSSLKHFKDIYIRYNGDITVKVYSDGKELNTKALTGNTTENLKVGKVYGTYGLELVITGIGIVYEIEFKPENREVD